jgi:hypothetical protein
MMRLVRNPYTLAAMFLALAASDAMAAPPAGADSQSPTARWYRGLRQPGTGMGCCDQSDCRPTHARRTNAGWEAQAPDGEWVPVPPALVLVDEAHPGGSAVLCWLPTRGVLCFVPPMAGS